MASAKVPVEVAKDGTGDGGRLATMAVGLDVTADGELHGMGVHWFLDPAIKCEGPQDPSPCGGRLAALLFLSLLQFYQAEHNYYANYFSGGSG